MPVGGLISGGASLVGGAIKGIFGASQRKKGKKMLNKLVMPKEELSKELLENQNLARTRATQGLPSEQYANAMKGIQRSQLSAFRAAKDRRGGLGSIAGIQQGTNDAQLDLNAKDAMMRVDNEGRLMDVNNQIAGWKSKLFDLNKRQPYQQQRDYAMSLMGAGNANMMAGLDQAVAGVGQGANMIWGPKPTTNNYYGSGSGV